MVQGPRRAAPALSQFALAVALGLLAVSLVGQTQAASAVYLTTSFTASNAAVANPGGLGKGVEVTFTNNLNTSLTPQIYAVLMNNASEVVGVSLPPTSTVMAGAKATYFASFPSAPAGNYTIVFIATTQDFVPLSAPTSVPIAL